ncbi:aminotransferase class I/II-fold pyridoxal phosphate-dependent enzyme [Amycolatopsis sp. WGS_07]|uniref:aminotransferase class I/II-fold pyridoxal phosphate-dependent enzyme n=1 Tax=Amycolatopsis sp. WGS_07 TaxID=3076764 RepID=UPI00387336B9
MRLSANESHLPPVKDAQRAMAAALSSAHRYPDATSAALIEAIATQLSAREDEIVVGPGSSALIRRLCAFARRGDDPEVLLPEPAFQALPRLARQAGLDHRTVPLAPDWTIDLDATADAIRPDTTRMVVISNPHNPTGTMHGTAALQRFLDNVPPQVLVVLDEAYIEYACLADETIALARRQWAAGRANLVVTRTFSKAHALAAQRIGYLLAPAQIAQAVAAAAVPFEVTATAQAGALASLHASGRIRLRCKRLGQERDRVTERLEKLGFRIPPSAANHVWLPLGRQSDSFAARCLEFGCAVLAYPGSGVRVTIGREPDDDLFLAAARDWTRDHRS